MTPPAPHPFAAVLAAAAHLLFETTVVPNTAGLSAIVALGMGPVGAAFLLWDHGMKRGDPRLLGALAYATPVASTVVLMLVTGRSFTWEIGAAIVLILGAAVVAMRER